VHNGPPTESFWRIAPARPIVVPIDLCPPSSQNVDPESILNACVIVDHLTLLEKPGEQVGHCIRIRCHGLPDPAFRGAIGLLADDPRPPSSRPLRGRRAVECALATTGSSTRWQLTVDVLLIVVVALGHRREVYDP